MGILTGLLTLPLAPVRGVAWLADEVRREAERQWADPVAVRSQIDEVESAFVAGELSQAERDERQDALVARLLTSRRTDTGSPFDG